jgi:Domain of unknown function (DUF4136)
MQPTLSRTMKPNALLSSRLSCFLLAILVAAAGCSSTPTKVDTGPIAARSFSFVKRGTTPQFADDRAPIHAAVQQAITRTLAAKGLPNAMSGQGDVTVAYLIIIGNNATTTAINDYFGYGEGASELVEKAHAAGTGSTNPNYFEAGTLVIDIIDSRSLRLLKRNYVVRPILRDPSPENRQVRIQEAVDSALKDLRIGM